MAKYNGNNGFLDESCVLLSYLYSYYHRAASSTIYYRLYWFVVVFTHDSYIGRMWTRPRARLLRVMSRRAPIAMDEAVGGDIRTFETNRWRYSVLYNWQGWWGEGG